MAENPRLFERVEVFTRATSDAFNKAIGEVLDAKGPWQLLYRLSRIVLLGLVLYTAWILISLQPDLARRLRTPVGSTLPHQLAAHQQQVQSLLRSSVRSGAYGLHTLVVVEWHKGGSFQVLAAHGRHEQLGLVPGNQTVVGVAMARVLGHVALGLCESEQPEALPIPQALPPGSDLLICPIGCTTSGGPAKGASGGLLLAVFERPSAAALSAQGASDTGASTAERLHRRQREQLMLIARHLGELLWSREG
jgi:hypothetical protein